MPREAAVPAATCPKMCCRRGTACCCCRPGARAALCQHGHALLTPSAAPTRQAACALPALLLELRKNRKETKGNNTNPITRTPPNYSNQKPQEGTGGKGLHSRRIAVQGLKISSPNSNPRSGEEERKKEKRERRRGARGKKTPGERKVDVHLS